MKLMNFIVTLMWNIFCGWHLHNYMPTGNIQLHYLYIPLPVSYFLMLKYIFVLTFIYSHYMTEKLIHIHLGNIYSRKFQSSAIAYSMENKCMIFFPFTPFRDICWCIIMRHQNNKRSFMSCDLFIAFRNKWNISMWPLTSKCQPVSFFLSISPTLIASSAQKGTPFCSFDAQCGE